jgi:hypothetical protein
LVIDHVLTIAGVGFCLSPDEPSCPYSLPAAYHPFLSETEASLTEPCGRYRITLPDTPRLAIMAGTPFWANEVWRMGNTHDGQVVIEIYDVIRDRWVAVANLSGDFSSGTIQPFYGRRAAPAPHALNYPYDQAILINRLLYGQVSVIHGAGIIVNGKGYIFFGPSGIGKTTISRLWVKRGAHLLNDDRVALYRTGSGWRIAGTPWHGEEPVVSPLSAPLAGIVRLRQSPENKVRELSATEGLTEIISCALIPFFSREGIERAFDLLGDLLEHVPAVEFSLRPEPSALDYFLAR